ncbi:ATP-binding protein [Massilia sp. W12]|uniref:ATP-binding protein n=1 Tax=Massilia sp. W12 TaxID=3126507 RepID=UPI0030D1B728
MASDSSSPLHRNAGLYLGLFFCLTLAAIVLQTWWAIAQDRKLTLETERGNGLVAVRLLQEHATQTLQEAERKLLSLAQMAQQAPPGASQDEDFLRRLAHKRLLDHGAIKALQFIDRQGQAWVTSLDYPAHSNDVSQRPDIKFLLLRPDFQDSVIGHPYPSRYDSQWVTPLSRHLFDLNGKWLGIISADVRIAYFGAVYARAAKNNDAAVALIANQGFIIVRSPFEARYVDRDLRGAPALAQFEGEAQEGIFSDPDFLDDEKARLYTWRKAPDFPITMVYGRDLEKILAPWQTRSRDRILFAGVIACLLGALTWYLRWHVRRLQRNQRNLRESEDKFIQLFQRSPLPLALLNLENDQFVEINQVFLEQFGYQRQDLLGNTPLAFWQSQAERQHYLDILHREWVVDRMDALLLHKSGQPLRCLLSSRLLEADGRRMVLFSPRDVTRQYQIEEEIRELNQQLEMRVRMRTQRLEQTNLELGHTLQSLTGMQRDLVQAEKMAALGSLVAAVAQELAQPIELGMQMAAGIASETREFSADIGQRRIRKSELEGFLLNSAQQAGVLLQSLGRAGQLVASFKQVAVDQASNQAREFDLRQVLEEIVTTNAPQYREREIAMQLDLQENIHMYSYPGPISQAISHFIANALQHAFEGRASGEMRLSCRKLDSETVEIVFADNGCGIPPEYQARVFEPFFSTRIGQGGIGLGMHVVYNLVTEVLGGSIVLHSEPGQGARFVLRLPLCAPALAPAEARAR